MLSLPDPVDVHIGFSHGRIVGRWMRSNGSPVMAGGAYDSCAVVELRPRRVAGVGDVRNAVASSGVKSLRGYKLSFIGFVFLTRGLVDGLGSTQLPRKALRTLHI